MNSPPSTPPTTTSEQTSLISLLKQLLWRFTYSSERNSEYIRSGYDSFSRKLKELEDLIESYLAEHENYLHMVILAVNGAYLFLIILTGIGIIPVYTYFRD
jgi:hypothetical protein